MKLTYSFFKFFSSYYISTITMLTNIHLTLFSILKSKISIHYGKIKIIKEKNTLWKQQQNNLAKQPIY